jgi:formate hydrogenlyase subunit 6/NADH:ubiquinone oxidoreductase subunit I
MADGSPHCTFEAGRLDDLLALLRADGWNLVGPRVRDGAIVYDEIASAEDLPIGWTDEQAPGLYRIRKRDDSAHFGYVVGPHSWKKFLFPPSHTLWSAKRTEDGIEVKPASDPPRRTAFIGVRACELAAIAVQDGVLMNGSFVDANYKARRENVLLVAVNCGQAGGTCFCVSMNTGPRARGGYDIALTEVLGGEHRFVADSGSERGAVLLSKLRAAAASADDVSAADAAVENAASQMGRAMDTDGIKDLLQRNYENPRWDDVALRCLSCTNCTMVCPTCFCSTIEDVPDLSMENAERVRRWDSCFTDDFSYIHGGNMRPSVSSRYRHWITHKLSTWYDQFGTSGCVGCGRCITWCPPGIDITEEVRAIRASEEASS